MVQKHHALEKEEKFESDEDTKSVQPEEIAEVKKELQQLEEEGDEAVTIEYLNNNPNLITPTFGEILISQQKFQQARHVFAELVKKEPGNERFVKKIQFLDRFIKTQNSPAG